MELETVFCFLSLLGHHHAGVVEEEIQAVKASCEVGDELFDGRQAGKVEQHQLHGGMGRGFGNIGHCLLAALLVAARHDHVGSFFCQSFGSLKTDAAVSAACNDCYASGLVFNIVGVPALFGHRVSPFVSCASNLRLSACAALADHDFPYADSATLRSEQMPENSGVCGAVSRNGGFCW